MTSTAKCRCYNFGGGNPPAFIISSPGFYSMAKRKRPEGRVYKVQFHSQGKLYELYAREVSQSGMYAFIEVADIIFGEKSQVVVDPSEERLKAEFSQVNRTYIPLHSVVRIDEVEKEGVNKIIDKPDDYMVSGHCCIAGDTLTVKNGSEEFFLHY